jgi:hypothetical protein
MNTLRTRRSRLLSMLSASSLVLLTLAGCGSDEMADDESTALTDEEMAYEETAAASEEMTETAEVSAAPEALGSAGFLDRTTLVVSIFVSDADYQWDFTNNAADQQTAQDTIKYVGIGTDFLKNAAAQYGKTADFVYDWNQNQDIVYETSFMDRSLANTDSGYDSVDYFVKQNIPADTLREEYSAENVIYLAFYNTPESFEITSNTVAILPSNSADYGADEMISVYTHCDGIMETPGVYAHEMLHCFGAPDLYSDAKDNDYGLTTDLRNAYVQIHPDDIMYKDGYDPVSDEPVYDHVPTQITDLTAYYVGLTDDSQFKDEYQLADSQYVQLEG